MTGNKNWKPYNHTTVFYRVFVEFLISNSNFSIQWDKCFKNLRSFLTRLHLSFLRPKHESWFTWKSIVMGMNEIPNESITESVILIAQKIDLNVIRYQDAATHGFQATQRYCDYDRHNTLLEHMTIFCLSFQTNYYVWNGGHGLQ